MRSWFCELIVDAVDQLYTAIVVPRLQVIGDNISELSESMNQISEAGTRAIFEQHLKKIRKSV